ncbi:hypothetical protein UACE39S_01733 [Ureibacillus acetophenoni]
MTTINERLAALDLLKGLMTEKDYKCYYAYILIDYYADLLDEANISKGRQYILNTVNNHLVRKGMNKISYQVVRNRIDSKWSV